MKKWSMAIVVLLVVTMGVGLATAPKPSDKPIVRLDPALDALVSPDAKLELVKGTALDLPRELSGFTKVRHLVNKHGASQVMIGTDYAVPWVKGPVDHILKTPGLSDAERVAILGGNAAKLMKIPT